MQAKKYLKIISIVLVLLCALIAFLLSPLFNFKTINVSGTDYYQNEDIKSSLSYLENKNFFIAIFENTPFSHLDYLFKGRLYEGEQQLLFDKPYLKSAKISFSFPGAADVKVEERTPVFYTRNGDEYLLIDSEGYVLEAFSQDDRPEYPVIEGVETLGYKVGSSLVGMGTDSQLELAIKVCNGMKQIGLSENSVNIVDVTDTDRIWMFVKPSLSICLGSEDDLSIKLSMLKEILLSGYDGNSNGVIDFTNGKNPIFKKNSETEQIPDLTMGTDSGSDMEQISGSQEIEIGENFLDESELT